MRYLKKKSYHLEEEVSEGSWAISYGDMITLLLSFFVLFFTTNPEADKVKKLNSFVSFSLDEMKPFTPIRPENKTNAVNQSIPKINGLDIKVSNVGDQIVVTFGSYSFFDSGKTEVREEAIKVLQRFSDRLIPFVGNYRISVKAFTDKRKVSEINLRRYKDNLELSALRSISAMRVLQKSGIPLARMQIAGAGEMNAVESIIPKADALTSEEINNISRTVVIVISPEKESWL
jgi:chemotaxis protein MotB